MKPIPVISREAVALNPPIPCPCCSQPVPIPTLDILGFHFGLTNVERRILGAVWKGRGMPVRIEKIFDAMYADDPDGGPAQSKMYAAFKVALFRLRDKLRGSQVWIENVAYRQGYRLVIKEMK